MKHIILVAFLALCLASAGQKPYAVPTPTLSNRGASTGLIGAKKGIQETRWSEAKLRNEWILKIDKAVSLFERNKDRYTSIRKANKNGVPESIIFGIHGRESSWSFTSHLHEGSPLSHRTRYVPKGRIPAPVDPPYTFEQSAEDALYVVDTLQNTNWRSIESTLNAAEGYNGWGYKKYHPDVPSPYLWSGTTIYLRGKYAADGQFSSTLADKQIGICAILLRMKERGMPLPWQ